MIKLQNAHSSHPHSQQIQSNADQPFPAEAEAIHPQTVRLSVSTPATALVPEDSISCLSSPLSVAGDLSPPTSHIATPSFATKSAMWLQDTTSPLATGAASSGTCPQLPDCRQFGSPTPGKQPPSSSGLYMARRSKHAAGGTVKPHARAPRPAPIAVLGIPATRGGRTAKLTNTPHTTARSPPGSSTDILPAKVTVSAIQHPSQRHHTKGKT